MLLIRNATIINEGASYKGSVLIKNERIVEIYTDQVPEEISSRSQIIEANNLYLIPGVIDDQVHFREPGLTHKGDIRSESRAAIAGGVTSYMEMPNTNPQTISIDAWKQKTELAHGKSFANYAFYLGATNDNLAELKKADSKNLCGIKIFMGASTGNMLVDDNNSLYTFFVMPIIGITQGMQPIIGYNHGAGNKKRVYKTLRIGIIIGSVFSTVVFTLLMIFAETFVSMFLEPGSATIAMAARGLRLFIIMLPALSIAFMGTAFFQSIAQSRIAIMLGSLRQFVILLPLLLTMPKIWHLDGVWAAAPVADGLTVLITLATLLWFYRCERTKAVRQGL